ncbi:ACT domain-containing protein [Agrococcus jejuensis]|uniref:CASTOR ACT domain-containing protein n=1 Tax=Agrococcus jejuensis TaxID=399736 RepID=A0A1G8EXM1_9MICO|nr:ACT domain-containing protein [Agrococcus jejuensis]SDH74653.1 hypothetical protein SAMN04489720_2234 [Agrococcus jejuensis]
MPDAAAASITLAIVPQVVEVLPGELVVEHDADPAAHVDAEGVVAIVRAPDGTTSIRAAVDADVERWVALWTGGTAHGLDAPGMTASIAAPLSAAGLAVFVVGTATADLVLVAADDRERALGVLSAAGHTTAD